MSEVELSYLDQLRNFNELVKRFEEKGEKIVGNAFAEVMQASCPDAIGICWAQDTPGFCDGDPCSMSREPLTVFFDSKVFKQVKTNGYFPTLTRVSDTDEEEDIEFTDGGIVFPGGRFGSVGDVFDEADMKYVTQAKTLELIWGELGTRNSETVFGSGYVILIDRKGVVTLHDYCVDY